MTAILSDTLKVSLNEAVTVAVPDIVVNIVALRNLLHYIVEKHVSITTHNPSIIY